MLKQLTKLLRAFSLTVRGEAYLQLHLKVVFNKIRLPLLFSNSSTNADCFVFASLGTENFITQHHAILQECESEEPLDKAVCNKDTGDSQKTLRKWSRGLLHFVRGGGHIERWCPLYV